MTRFLTFLLLVAAAVSFTGCDDAKNFVSDTKEGYQELERIAQQLGQVSSAVKTNDFAQAKEFVRKLEPLLNTRVLSWVVQVLAIEEREGVEAARAAIERFRTSDGITVDERTALDKMQAFYRGNTGRTGDLLVLIAAVVVEQKYKRHGTAAAFVQICQKLRTSVPTNGVSVTNMSNTR